MVDEIIHYATLSFSIRELMDFMSNGKIQTTTDIGTDKIWKKDKPARFIEGIFMGLPLFPMFVDSSLFNSETNSYDKWIVIDGYNRLITLEAYTKNKLKVKGFSFDDLDSAKKRNFLNKDIIVYALPPNTPLKMRYEVFKRVNPSCNLQDIRHILNQGKPDDLVQELAKRFEKVFSVEKRDGGRVNTKEFMLYYLMLCYLNEENNITNKLNLDWGMNQLNQLNKKNDVVLAEFDEKINKIPQNLFFIKKNKKDKNIFDSKRKNLLLHYLIGDDTKTSTIKLSNEDLKLKRQGYKI